MTPAARHRWLGFAAALTALASVWALDDDEQAVRPAPLGQAMAVERPASAAAAPASAVDATEWTLPERAPLAAPPRRLFAVAAGLAPVAVAVAASAAPPAPPVITLPFAFGGRLVTEAGAAVLLNEGPLTHVLPVGASQGDFRLDADTGSQLEFVHVPSGQRLVLPLQP